MAASWSHGDRAALEVLRDPSSEHKMYVTSVVVVEREPLAEHVVKPLQYEVTATATWHIVNIRADEYLVDDVTVVVGVEIAAGDAFDEQALVRGHSFETVVQEVAVKFVAEKSTRLSEAVQGTEKFQVLFPSLRVCTFQGVVQVDVSCVAVAVREVPLQVRIGTSCSPCQLR